MSNRNRPTHRVDHPTRPAAKQETPNVRRRVVNPAVALSHPPVRRPRRVYKSYDGYPSPPPSTRSSSPNPSSRTTTEEPSSFIDPNAGTHRQNHSEPSRLHQYRDNISKRTPTPRPPHPLSTPTPSTLLSPPPKVHVYSVNGNQITVRVPHGNSQRMATTVSTGSSVDGTPDRFAMQVFNNDGDAVPCYVVERTFPRK